MSDSTFRGLLKDLGIFFGTVFAFVGGFLMVSYVMAPSRNPYGFWLGFLLLHVCVFEGASLVVGSSARPTEHPALETMTLARKELRQCIGSTARRDRRRLSGESVLEVK
jgi:hypothetical protein